MSSNVFLVYLISTIPVQYDIAAYASVVKPNGFYTHVSMPVGFNLTLSNIGLANTRINFNASLIGGIPETQEVLSYCAHKKVFPKTEIIKTEQVNEAWKKVLNKQAWLSLCDRRRNDYENINAFYML